MRDGPLTTRSGFLLKLYDAEGHVAWGEAAPLPGFSRENLDTCRSTLVEAAESLMARGDVTDDGALGELPVFQSTEAFSAAYFAVESAWRQLVATKTNTLPWKARSRFRDASLLLNALLTGDEDTIRQQAEHAVATGYQAVKLKVGRAKMADDLRLVEMVRDIIGPKIELRLDANQAWSLEDAILFGKAVRRARISYIEEPCASPFDLPAFQEATGLRYAVDESIRTLHDLIQGRDRPGPFADLPVLQVVQRAKAIIWKPTLIHSPELGKLLFEESRPGQTRILVITGSFETGIGTAALANYAALFSSPGVPVGLDTYRWIDPDVLEQRLPLNGGVVDLKAINEASKTVDESRLTRIWPR